MYQKALQLCCLDSTIWGTNEGAKRFHAFQWCICGCPWLSMVRYTNYPPFLCHSVLHLHLFSRSLATDSSACSIHYFSFVSNASVLWILALLCFIQDLVTCVDFSRPCTVFLLFCLQTATWEVWGFLSFFALAVEAVLQFDLHKISISEVMVWRHLQMHRYSFLCIGVHFHF